MLAQIQVPPDGHGAVAVARDYPRVGVNDFRLPYRCNGSGPSMVPLVLGLLGDLTAGASMAGSGSCDSGTGDLLCSDDLTQWRSFANSFQMRLTMRLSEVDPATA